MILDTTKTHKTKKGPCDERRKTMVLYIYIYICRYVCVYIYIERERERKMYNDYIDNGYIVIYIYIYITAMCVS